MERVTLQVKRFPLKWRRKITSRAVEKGKENWEILVEALEIYFQKDDCSCHAKRLRNVD